MSSNLSSDLTEQTAQAIIMRYALDVLSHHTATINITTIYPWECDVLSLTSAAMAHEFEIKCSLADFSKEFKNKKRKHLRLDNREFGYGARVLIPNYYWFVCFNGMIKPSQVPEYSGLISIQSGIWLHDDLIKSRQNYTRSLKVLKNAPRLHRKRVSNSQRLSVGRIASLRVKKLLCAIETGAITTGVKTK